MMNQEYLQKLAAAADAQELRRLIEPLCQPFGNPENIRILFSKDTEEYVCLLELGPPNLNSFIIENLGGFYFADGVAFRIPAKHAKPLASEPTLYGGSSLRSPRTAHYERRLFH
jgi:hypothetical protein